MPVNRKVRVWYHRPTFSPAMMYKILCIRPKRTACSRIPTTVPSLPQKEAPVQNLFCYAVGDEVLNESRNDGGAETRKSVG